MADVEQNVIAYWDDGANTYDRAAPERLVEETRPAWLEQLHRVLPMPPATVVDLGAGAGFLSLLIAELGHRVRGIDTSERMLARARADADQRGLAATFELGNVNDPPVEDSGADVVTSRYIFWTLVHPERALAASRRLLRPGGLLVIIDGFWHAGGFRRPAPDSARYERSRRYFTEEVVASLPLLEVTTTGPLEALVRDSGFVDLVVRPLDIVEQGERHVYGDEDPLGVLGRGRFILTAKKPA